MRDRAVGLVLYLALVIIVDSFLNTGIFIPGMEYGSIRYSEVCALFLILYNPPKRYSKRDNRLFFKLLFLYFFLYLVAAFRGITIEDGLNNFRRYIIPQITALWVAYRGFDKDEDYGRFLFYFMTLLILIALFTFWDVFFDRWIMFSEGLNTQTYSSGRKNGRFGSFFLNPNYMGAFAVLVFPVIFIRTLLERNIIKTVFCWTGVLALTFAFVETQSRGPMLSLLVAMSFFIFMPTKGYSFIKKTAFLIVLVFVIYLFMPGFFEHAIERFSTIESEMAMDKKSRNTVWEYTIEVIRNNPLLGVGLGEITYFKRMIQAGFREEMMARPLDNPHNSYLEIAVTAGIPALILFISFNAVLIRKGISKILALSESAKDNSLYLMGFIAGLLGFLACLFPDMYLFTQNVAPAYWIIFGLTYSIAIKAEGPEEA